MNIGIKKVHESNYKFQVLVKIVMNINKWVHSFWASGTPETDFVCLCMPNFGCQYFIPEQCLGTAEYNTVYLQSTLIIVLYISCMPFAHCYHPRGQMVVSVGDEEAILWVTIIMCDILSSDLGHVDDVCQQVPVLQQRRTDLYILTETTWQLEQLLQQHHNSFCYIIGELELVCALRMYMSSLVLLGRLQHQLALLQTCYPMKSSCLSLPHWFQLGFLSSPWYSCQFAESREGNW